MNGAVHWFCSFTRLFPEDFRMGTSQNWLKALEQVRHTLLLDAVHMARLGISRPPTGIAEHLDGSPRVPDVPAAWAKLPNPPLPDLKHVEALLARQLSDPNHPASWHRRHLEHQLAKPETAETYLKIRRALWNWPEFASVCRRARAILDVVIELAREEAFPWFVPVCAQDVRKLSRLSPSSYIRSVLDLDCLAITRPARVVDVMPERGIVEGRGLGTFPGRVDASKPMESIAQWVIRYRRGIPWNSKRAAWWLNYDVLCETGRVLPCFVVSPMTLAKPYQDRNERQGARERFCDPSAPHEQALQRWQRRLSLCGPMPPPGLRAAPWEPSAQ
jgi:hypothetical protein